MNKYNESKKRAAFSSTPLRPAIFPRQRRTAEQRDALLAQKYLEGWRVEVQPLIFSFSPSAFDEQTTFTLKAYRGMDWEALQKEKRPSYGNPVREAGTAEEEQE